jgi:hypothetical protein
MAGSLQMAKKLPQGKNAGLSITSGLVPWRQNGLPSNDL